MSPKADVLQGTLDLMVLKTLEARWGTTRATNVGRSRKIQ